MVTLLLPIAHPPRLPRPAAWAAAPLAVFAESRPGVQLVFLMRSSATSGIVTHPSVHRLTGILGWALLTIAIYVFNGVTDLATDTANRSTRPIASGLLSRSSALAWCAALAGAGMAACWQIGLMQTFLGAAMLVLGWAYSSGPTLKNSPTGFAVVIGLGAALTYAAGWVAGGHVTMHDLALALSVSLWVGLCCASKDFSDIDGDRLAGRRTWPVVLGPQRAAHLLSVLAVSAATGVLVLAGVSGADPVPAAALVMGSIALAFTATRSASAPDRITRRRPYRAFLTTQYTINGAMLTFGAV